MTVLSPADVAEQLLAAGLLDHASRVPAEALHEPWAARYGIVAAIDGSVPLNGQDLRLRLALPAGFPAQLPLVFSLERELRGQILHLLQDDRICFHAQEGVLLDRYRPVELAREALRLAVETVRRGLAGENRADFLEELPLHWPGQVEGLTFFDANDTLRPVYRVILPTLAAAFVEDTEQAQALTLMSLGLQVWPFPAFMQSLPRPDLVEGLYIPLTSVPRPPERLSRAPWTATRIGQFIRQNLSSDQQARLAELTRAKKRKTPPSTFVLLRVPRPSSGHHIVGVRYDQIRGYHPLARAPGEANVTQFRVERRDPGFLLPRGGGGEDLRAKRVLLIGCGAVGGHVAMELARCGVGHLTCVDPDILQASNAHRHVLGSPPLMIEPHKAGLLALEIKQRYPWTSTDQIPTGIGQALAAGMVDLARYDLVIAATGDHNLERALNARFFTTSDRAPLLFTWLEPLGLGGHAVVVPPRGPDTPRGCFDCLFTADPADPAPVLANRAAFAAPGQDFAQETAGCGQTFTPYSSLDALRTAELAVRLAVDTLRHGAPDARLRSWKGDAAVFRQAGYQTSARYDLDAWPLEHDGAAIFTPHCRVCGES